MVEHKKTIAATVLLFAWLCYKNPIAMNEVKYAMSVDWFDDIAGLDRRFNLFYYPNDRTVEMFDIRQKKTFLRRSYCDSVSEAELYLGNTVRIFARDLKLLEYLNQETAKALEQKTERTYAMLKPEVIHQMGKLLTFIEGKGFQFNRMQLTHLSPGSVAEFYKEHSERPFYNKLVTYISSGPVLAMELLAPSAITRWRKVLGPTDPVKARQEQPESLRALFGEDATNNAAHGSDSPQAATRELNLIFKYEKSYLGPSQSYTLCLVKPHIIAEGRLGELVAHIQGSFTIAALKTHKMSEAEAERFFEAYKGVWDDYMVHIKNFISGPVVAMAIASDVNSFREFTGPFDPEVARKLRPSSVRGRFGGEPPNNVIHCTDLDGDGNRELKAFFE